MFFFQAKRGFDELMKQEAKGHIAHLKEHFQSSNIFAHDTIFFKCGLREKKDIIFF